MHQLSDLYQTVAESSIKDLNIVLSSFSEHQAFRQTAVSLQNVASHITSAISKSTSRYEGLLQLQAVLPQCPVDLLAERAPTWMTMCIKSCKSKDVKTAELGFKTLRPLLIRMSKVPELNKSVSSGHIGKIIECILTTSTLIQVHALRCLETCLRVYSGSSGAQKSSIEAYLILFVDSRDNYKVKAAAKCLHLLQQVRGGGVLGIVHKTLWKQQLSACVASMHEVLDTLYENHLEVSSSPDLLNKLSLPPFEFGAKQTVISRYIQIVNRFHNLCYFVDIMLLESFTVPKQVQPDLLIQLISRGLGVSCLTLSNRVTSEGLVLGALLPNIHCQLLKLLDSVIKCLGRNILCYAQVICQFVVQTLKWTEAPENNNGQTKPYRSLRITAYKVLTHWLKVSTAGSCVELVIKNLVPHITEDITPFKDLVKLSVQSGAHKFMSRKERNNLKHARNVNRDSQALIVNAECQDEDNELLCVAALECLQYVINATGHFLNPEMNEAVQLKVVRFLFDAHSNVVKRGLYANSAARLELYGVLFALTQNPVPSVESPTLEAVRLFSFGKTDSNLKIAQACTSWLNVLINQIQSRPEALQSEKSQQATKNQLMKNLLNEPKDFIFHEGKIISIKLPDTNKPLGDPENDNSVQGTGNPELLEKMKIIMAAKAQNVEDSNLPHLIASAKEIIRCSLNSSNVTEHKSDTLTTYGEEHEVKAMEVEEVEDNATDVVRKEVDRNVIDTLDKLEIYTQDQTKNKHKTIEEKQKKMDLQNGVVKISTEPPTKKIKVVIEEETNHCVVTSLLENTIVNNVPENSMFEFSNPIKLTALENGIISNEIIDLVDESDTSFPINNTGEKSTLVSWDSVLDESQVSVNEMMSSFVEEVDTENN